MRTIALVEDNADNRLIARLMLRDRYRLVEYEDGPSALEGIRRRPPDLVLLDISLPGMDGTQVLDGLRGAFGGRLPVVAFTAHAELARTDLLRQLGFDDLVLKPVVSDLILVETIERVFARALNAAPREAAVGGGPLM